MKKIQPEIDEIKLKYKDNKQEQALKTMNLYKEKGVNPFSGVFLAFIQLPILIALYMVFYKGGLSQIHLDTLYSFPHQKGKYRCALVRAWRQLLSILHRPSRER